MLADSPELIKDLKELKGRYSDEATERAEVEESNQLNGGNGAMLRTKSMHNMSVGDNRGDDGPRERLIVRENSIRRQSSPGGLFLAAKNKRERVFEIIRVSSVP